jgi:hypothetical protein
MKENERGSVAGYALGAALVVVFATVGAGLGLGVDASPPPDVVTAELGYQLGEWNAREYGAANNTTAKVEHGAGALAGYGMEGTGWVVGTSGAAYAATATSLVGVASGGVGLAAGIAVAY